MDTGVQEGTEATLTSSDKPNIVHFNEMKENVKRRLLPWAPPAEEGESAMMDYMKGREVRELLTGDKEH